MKTPCLAALAMAVAVASSPVQAAETISGHDGVVSQCVFHTKKAFAKIMCDTLADAAGKEAGKAKIRHMHLGSADWTEGAEAYLAPPADSGFENPLYLTFYLRGTDGNTAGAHAWASLYAPVEADGPFDAKIVFWEGATLGSGPPKPLAKAVGQTVAKKLTPVFEELGTAMAQ